MIPTQPRAASIAAILAVAALSVSIAVPAAAGSLAGSSAAGGSSASSAASAVSDSVGTSSDSSKRAVAEAQGPYRVVDLAPAADRPGMVRVTLQPIERQAAAAPLVLVLPERAVERGGLAAGGTINAHQRSYGVELARADTQRAFFLLLTDDARRELRSSPVSL